MNLAKEAKRTRPRSYLAGGGIISAKLELAVSGLADTQLASAKLLVITVTFFEDHAENVSDNNDESGARDGRLSSHSRLAAL
jgi:hypothetical protein